MRWEDERYVRVYTRDTADWMALSFEAQGLFLLLLRRMDRAGVLPLGKHGTKAVAIVIGHVGEWDRLSSALEELLADGCIAISGDDLHVPNFTEAQEAKQTDKERQRKSRELARFKNAFPSIADLAKPAESIDVCHTPSHGVTPSRAVLSRAEPAVLSLFPENASASSELGEQPPPLVAPKGKKQKPPKPEKPTDPRHAPLVKALTDAFGAARGADYGFARKDATAVQRLLSRSADDGEIARRWRLALTHPIAQKRVSELLVFESRWNEFGGPVVLDGQRPIDFRKAPVRAEDIPKSAFEKTGAVNDF